ncbi:MAG: GIY-YIG nuclease family protein [Sedimentibacter sp.]|uniref:GIY-YIG nuclease family protein n=1 Tax=Sedimentibacter sp. TaxID=1960295 RepID=UPI00315955CC
MDRKKELKELYKQTKSEMGIFAVQAKDGGYCFLETTKNLKGKINSTRFQLQLGSHPNKDLQQKWNELGEEAFEIAVLEKLEYDKDESKTDYSEELSIMKMLWDARLKA